MIRLSTCLAGFGVLALALSAQEGTVPSRPSSEATARDAARIVPFPPVGVTARLEAKTAVISWKPILLERIVGYEVYRKVGDSPFQRLDQIKGSVFVDKNPPAGKVEYAVTAVDRFANKSDLSKPVQASAAAKSTKSGR